MWTVDGRRYEGALVGVGADFVALADRGDQVVVRIDAVTVVRPRPGHGGGAASGDRPAALDLTLVELLARVVDDRPDVALAMDGGETVAGSLLSAGADVLTVQVASGEDGVGYS